MSCLIEKIEAEAASLFLKHCHILVAVSGGVDSMVLLHCLKLLSNYKQYEWKVSAAHFNHMLRGTESHKDQALVSNYAKKLKVKAVQGEWKQDAILIKEHGIEMAARVSRYKFLAKTSKKLRCEHIATAHHSDDQVETFLWRLMRGAGGKGLGGAQPSSSLTIDKNINLARPLLNFSKKELLEYARDNSIPFREDHTNTNTKYLRNKIRKNLIPYLKRNYRTNIETSILQSQDLVFTDADYSSESAIRWLEADTRDPFANLHKAVKRWIVWHQLIQFNIEPQYSLIEDLIGSVGKSICVCEETRATLGSNGILRLKKFDRLYFDELQTLIQLKSKWTTHNFGKTQIKCKVTPQNKLNTPSEEVFDAHYLGKHILLRYWQPGDRFQPIGCKHNAKLQDLFTNAKIGAREKRSCIVACTSDGFPFWVQGLRIGELAKITSKTTKFLHWKWRKI